MSRINKFVLTVSLLIFIMISAVACGIYTQMVKERVYGLKQSVIDTAFAVANIAEYRRSVAIDLINTLNPTEEQLLVGLRTAYADSVSPSYLYDVGPYLISSDECIQVKEFEKIIVQILCRLLSIDMSKIQGLSLLMVKPSSITSIR
ncbi:hypothetical protein MUTS16_33610 [Escherichia coli]|nr:hypothetical protein MUTS16_33610 [Escherichia coli]